MSPRSAFSVWPAVAIVLTCLVACGGPAPETPAEPTPEPAPEKAPESAPAADDFDPGHLIGGWSLEIPLDMMDLAPEGFAITLQFAEEGRISGSSGCNRYNGQAELADGPSLSFGPLATTRMACPEAQMALEDSYVSVLGDVTGFRIREDKLELLQDDEVVLVYLPEQ